MDNFHIRQLSPHSFFKKLVKLHKNELDEVCVRHRTDIYFDILFDPKPPRLFYVKYL